LAELQKSRPFRIREFYQKYGRPSREVLNERMNQIQKAQPLTLDGAVLMASVMMVQALVAQIRPLRLAIENYDQEIERVFGQHPDRVVFESFPGAGKVLAPRLLAAFGADRDRFQTALEVQEFSGIAPVTERSGKAIWVHRRLACPKFMLQTFHEFANCAWRFCTWSKLYYQQQRARGQGSSRGRPCSRLQMDSHYVPVLEGSHALRRQPLREIANEPRLAPGKSLKPTVSGFCCGNFGQSL